MIKKFASLALVGLLAMPAVTLAESLEDRVAALEESAEKWDLSSRISWSGDYRFRADMMSAEAPEHYRALDIARGTEWFTDPNVLAQPGAGGYTTNDNVHTVNWGPMAAANFGTANMIYAFFHPNGDGDFNPYNDPSPQAAGAAGMLMGYRRFLVGDDVCLQKESVRAACNIVDIVGQKYENYKSEQGPKKGFSWFGVLGA